MDTIGDNHSKLISENIIYFVSFITPRFYRDNMETFQGDRGFWKEERVREKTVEGYEEDVRPLYMYKKLKTSKTNLKTSRKQPSRNI